MSYNRPARVLVAKPGLDGHDRGAKVIAFALREAGCEVIYLGLRCTPDRIMGAAAEEDVDVVGISVLSGAHVPLVTQLIEARGMHKLGELPIVVGGIVPPRDIERLRSLGVSEVFPAGSDIRHVVDRVMEIASVSRKAT